VELTGLGHPLVVAGFALSISGRVSAVHRGREDFFRMRDAIDQYDADNGEYPPTLDALATEQYVGKVPVDPLTSDSNSWLVVPAAVDPRSPCSSPGICDIKSVADGVALDGSRYGGW